MNSLSSRAWETESEASLAYVVKKKKNNKMTASKSSVSYKVRPLTGCCILCTFPCCFPKGQYYPIFVSKFTIKKNTKICMYSLLMYFILLDLIFIKIILYSSLRIFLYVFHVWMYIYVCMCVCVPCLHSACGRQKGASKHLELELQMVLSCHWLLGTVSGSSAKLVKLLSSPST